MISFQTDHPTKQDTSKPNPKSNLLVLYPSNSGIWNWIKISYSVYVYICISKI